MHVKWSTLSEWLQGFWRIRSHFLHAGRAPQTLSGAKEANAATARCGESDFPLVSQVYAFHEVIIQRFNKVTQAKPWGLLVLRGADTCQNFLPPHCTAAGLGWWQAAECCPQPLPGLARGGSRCTAALQPCLRGVRAGGAPGWVWVSRPKAGGLRKCRVPNLPSEKSKYAGNLAKWKCNSPGNA